LQDDTKPSEKKKEKRTERDGGEGQAASRPLIRGLRGLPARPVREGTLVTALLCGCLVMLQLPSHSSVLHIYRASLPEALRSKLVLPARLTALCPVLQVMSPLCSRCTQHYLIWPISLLLSVPSYLCCLKSFYYSRHNLKVQDA